MRFWHQIPTASPFLSPRALPPICTPLLLPSVCVYSSTKNRTRRPAFIYVLNDLAGIIASQNKHPAFAGRHPSVWGLALALGFGSSRRWVAACRPASFGHTRQHCTLALQLRDAQLHCSCDARSFQTFSRVTYCQNLNAIHVTLGGYTLAKKRGRKRLMLISSHYQLGSYSFLKHRRADP